MVACAFGFAINQISSRLFSDVSFFVNKNRLSHHFNSNHHLNVSLQLIFIYGNHLGDMSESGSACFMQEETIRNHRHEYYGVKYLTFKWMLFVALQKKKKSRPYIGSQEDVSA